MGARAQKFDHAFDQAAQLHLFLIERHHARFDLGEIEDVADQRKKRFTGLANCFGIGALLGLQFGFEQKPRHAQHAVHGRADFVAHRGKEARFRAAAGFGAVARFGERVFQRLALRHIAPDALHFDEPAEGIADGVILPRDPAPAIGGAHMLVVAHAALAGLEAGEAAEHRGAAVGVQFGGEGKADGVFWRQPEQFEERIIGIGEAAVGGSAENGVALAVDKAAIALFAFVQPRVHGGCVLQRIFELGGGGGEFVGLLVQRVGLLADDEEAVQHHGDAHPDQRHQRDGRDDGEPAVQHDVAKRCHGDGESQHPEDQPNGARDKQVSKPFPAIAQLKREGP